jgi:hypothetical protein
MLTFFCLFLDGRFGFQAVMGQVNLSVLRH